LSELSAHLGKEAVEDAIYGELLSQEAVDDAILHEYMRRKNMRSKSRDFLHYKSHVAPWFVIEEIHILIAQAFDELAFGDLDRLMLFLPPRAGKSELSSKLLPAWWEGLYPTDQILHTSYAGTLVEKFGRMIRNLIMSDLYQEIFPDTKISKDSKAAGQWATSKGGVYNAAGVGAGIAGKGFNCLEQNVRLQVKGGIKSASSLAVGDEILSSTGWQEIRQIFLTTHEGHYIINGRLRVTAEHPMWVEGQWVPAGSLKPGMRLSTLTLWRKLWLRTDSLVKHLKRKLGMR
jgi:hypothetical protein